MPLVLCVATQVAYTHSWLTPTGRTSVRSNRIIVANQNQSQSDESGRSICHHVSSDAVAHDHVTIVMYMTCAYVRFENVRQ